MGKTNLSRFGLLLFDSESCFQVSFTGFVCFYLCLYLSVERLYRMKVNAVNGKEIFLE